MVINLVKFSGLYGWDEELAGLLLLSTEDNSIFGKDSNDGSILIDMLDGILHLEETAIWIKGGGSTIVLVRL